MGKERPQAVGQMSVIITIMDSESHGPFLNISIADTEVEKNLNLVPRTGVGKFPKLDSGVFSQIREKLNASHPLYGSCWDWPDTSIPSAGGSTPVRDHQGLEQS